MTTYIFKIISLLGGLSLFLFGMDVMGKALERQAGGKLQTILAKMSSNVFKGFLLGLGVTAVIQSSSATTVMVVGFVNSGIMTLKQAVGVIMGSNIGTTVTAWILSLSGLEGDSFIIKLFKPSTLAPPDRYHRHYAVHGQEREAERHRYHLLRLHGADDWHGSDEQLHVLPEK